MSFFQQISRMIVLNTGNGFLSTILPFQGDVVKEALPRVYGQTRKVLGTKDYVNFRLTGRVATDHSYASGTGIYDLVLGITILTYYVEPTGASYFPNSSID